MVGLQLFYTFQIESRKVQLILQRQGKRESWLITQVNVLYLQKDFGYNHIFKIPRSLDIINGHSTGSFLLWY